MTIPATAVEARGRLISEFRKSVVGPGQSDELLVDSPSRTYLCGFLSPVGVEAGDEQNDEFQEGDNEASLEGVPSLVNAMWPSAMGMTFHVHCDTRQIRVKITGAFYVPVLVKEEPLPESDDQGSEKSTVSVSGILGELVNSGKHKEENAAPEELGSAADKEQPQFKRWQRISFEKTVFLPVDGPAQEEMQLSGAGSPIDGLFLDVRRFDHGGNMPRLFTVSLVNRNTHKFAFFTFGLSDFREAWVQSSWLIWFKLVNLIFLLYLRNAVINRFYPASELF